MQKSPASPPLPNAPDKYRQQVKPLALNTTSLTHTDPQPKKKDIKLHKIIKGEACGYARRRHDLRLKTVTIFKCANQFINVILNKKDLKKKKKVKLLAVKTRRTFKCF